MTPSAAPSTGRTPEGLQVVLDVPHPSAASGQKIAATLVVTNPTGHDVRVYHQVNSFTRCTPKFGIALKNKAFDRRVLFTAECGSAPLIIKPGVSRLPQTILTTYLSCSQDGHTSVDSPSCLPSGGMPGIPPGRYEAYVDGGVFGEAPPVPIEVTAAQR